MAKASAPDAVLDHFATLGVPRSPWLDPVELKQRFLSLSADLHPDKAAEPAKASAEARFQELNTAYNVLRGSRSRLVHLLELSAAAKAGAVEALPADALELFAPMATLTKRADALLKEKSSITSPMLKVQFLQKAVECVDELQALQAQVQQRLARVEAELQKIGEQWASSIGPLQQAAAALGFYERWNAQLQERAAALTF